MHTLYLNSEEKKLFQSFSDALKDSWKVEDEVLVFTDTAEQLSARISLTRLHDPTLLGFLENMRSATSQEQALEVLESMDLKQVSDEDLMELFFGLGPDLLSKLILPMLSKTKTEAELQDAAALLFVRHSLLEAFSS